MTSADLFRVIGEIDDRWLEEEAVVAKSRRPLWVMCAAVAACAMLCALWLVYAPPLPTPSKNISSAVSAVTSARTTADMVDVSDQAYILDGDRVLYIGSPSLACYAGPIEAGTILWDMYLRYDLSAFEDDDLFWVEITPHNQDSSVVSKVEREAEAERLASCGLEIYTYDHRWTGYWGEEKQYTYIAAVLSKKEIENFPVSAAYGYIFSFVNRDKDMYTRVQPTTRCFPVSGDS